jgi:hypothetical protein
MVYGEANTKSIARFSQGARKKWRWAFPFDYLMIVLEKCSRLVKLFS